MMLDRMEGNAELKNSVQLMLAARRLTHSVLLVGEEGLGAGFAARCIAADYLYPAGGAPLRPFCGANAAVLWVSLATATAAMWRPASCVKRSAFPVWAQAANIWSVRSRLCAARSSTPAFRPRAVPCCSTMWKR